MALSKWIQQLREINRKTHLLLKGHQNGFVRLKGRMRIREVKNNARQ
jgi:hypothetical protein